MSDYLGYVANFPLGGIKCTTEIRDGRIRITRNLIHLNIGGFKLELQQDSSLPMNYSELTGRRVHTTNVLVRNIAQEKLGTIRKVVGYVCELLSFATESRVLPYGYDYPAGSGEGERKEMVGTIQMWRPPFSRPKDVKNYVELCYERFVSKREPRKLNIAIDYIYHSIAKDLALEPKIILACIALENLRHNWALDAGYPFLVHQV